MKKLKILILTTVMILSNLSYFTYASDGDHWVLGELAQFKQLILEYSDSLTQEEWTDIKDNVLNSDKLDDPISTNNWATLIKMILNPDDGKSGDMINMYVYGLSQDNTLTREAAVGGLVKLLTKDYIRGSVSVQDLEPAKLLEDLDKISDKQHTLVQKAYVEGILDSQTLTLFRPMDHLTNGEAVSILYQVLEKYKPGNQQHRSNEEHWSFYKIKAYADRIGIKEEQLRLVDKMARSYEMLDSPVEVEDWNSLLLYTLGLEDRNKDGNTVAYTIGLSDHGFMRRDKAVAGVMKLLHIVGFVEARDATEEELSIAAETFCDFGDVFDQSKLAIAYHEGLITGYSDSYFRPTQQLTNGEALALLYSIVEKYVK